jgi:hypothetical protein
LQILWVNIVTGGPAPSPFACDFDPFHVPRVQARPSELRRWLDELDRGPLGRFVSDGDADAVTIPAGARGELRRTLGPGIASSKRIGRARTTANDVASPPQRGAHSPVRAVARDGKWLLNRYFRNGSAVAFSCGHRQAGNAVRS